MSKHDFTLTSTVTEEKNYEFKVQQKLTTRTP